jgi:hypothetical protein
MCYKCTILLEREKNLRHKQQSTQSKNQSDTSVRREDDEM